MENKLDFNKLVGESLKLQKTTIKMCYALKHDDNIISRQNIKDLQLKIETIALTAKINFDKVIYDIEEYHSLKKLGINNYLAKIKGKLIISKKENIEIPFEKKDDEEKLKFCINFLIEKGVLDKSQVHFS